MMIRDLVSALSAPEMLQVASNGIWEESLSLGVASPDSGFLLDQWLAANTAHDIGLELIFGHAVFGMVLVGIRLPNDPHAQQMIRLIAGKVLSRDPASPPDHLDHLEHILCGSESLFPLTCPDLIELGVFNQWLSMEPITLFRGASDGQNRAPEWSMITKAPPRGARFPILLEVGYQLPVRHWVGVQVSEERHGRQFVSEEKLTMARSLIASTHQFPPQGLDDDP